MRRSREIIGFFGMFQILGFPLILHSIEIPLVFLPTLWTRGEINEVFVQSFADAICTVHLKRGVEKVFEIVGLRVEKGKPVVITVPPAYDNQTFYPSYFLTIRLKYNNKETFSRDFHIRVSQQIRWLLIETDKPAYKPNEEVKIRILALTSEYKSLEFPIKLDIRDPTSMIVYKTALIHTRNDLLYRKVTVPLSRHCRQGLWTITVRDAESNRIAGTNHFSVFDYSSSNFRINLIPETNYFVHISDDINIALITETFAGLFASGKAVIKCFCDQVRYEHTLFVEVMKGTAYFKLKPQDCLSRDFDHKFTPDICPNLNISVSLTNFGTGEFSMDQITLIRRSVTFDLDVVLLRPGLTTSDIFPVQVIVKSFAQERFWKSITFASTVHCLKDRSPRIVKLNDSYSRKLNSDKPLLLNFLIPRNQTCSAIFVEMTLTRYDNRQSFNLLIPRLIHPKRAFIQMKKFVYAAGEQVNFEIRRPYSEVHDENYSCLVFCQSGYLLPVSENHNGTTAFNSSAVMIPKCLLVLLSHEVQDVVTLIITDGCQNMDNKILPKQDAYKPGSSVIFQSIGPPNGVLSVLAADKRLQKALESQYYANKPRRTESLVNLYDFLVDVDQFGRPNFRGLAKVINETKIICCNAGLIFWQTKNDCPATSGFSVSRYLEFCQAAFTECCEKTAKRTPVAAPACQSGGRNNCGAYGITSYGKLVSNEKNLIDAVDAMKEPRTNFPEVWLFDEFNFGDSRNATIRTPTKVPDSITEWMFFIRTIHPDFGFCFDKFEVTTRQSIYIELDLPKTAFIGQQILLRVSVVNLGILEMQVSLEIEHTLGICSTNPLFEKHELALEPMNSSYIIVPMEFMQEGIQSAKFTLKSMPQSTIIDQQIRFVDVQVDLKRWRIDDSEFRFSLNSRGASSAHAASQENKYFEVAVNPPIALLRIKEVDDYDLRNSELILEFKRLGLAISSLPMERDTDNFYVLKILRSQIVDQIKNSVHLANLLRSVIILLNIITARSRSRIDDIVLLESKKLLDYGTMEMMSFRNGDGSFRNSRSSASKSDFWLTVLATLIQCRTHQDDTQVLPSLKLLTDQDVDKITLDEISFAPNKQDDLFLYSVVLATAVKHCQSYFQANLTLNNAIRTNVNRFVEHFRRHKVLQLDSLLLSAQAYGLLKWDEVSPPDSLLNEFLSRLEKSKLGFVHIPYRPKPGSFMERIKHRTKTWFSSSYRTRLKSNEVLANALLCSLISASRSDRHVKLEIFSKRSEIVNWLIASQASDGGFFNALDTYFALEALSFGSNDDGSMQKTGNGITFVVLECQPTSTKCPNVKLGHGNTMETVVLQSKNVQKITFRLENSSVPVSISVSLSNKYLSADDRKDYPLIFKDSIIDKAALEYEICFDLTEPSLHSCSIEHTLPHEVWAIRDSVKLTTGNATIAFVDETQRGITIGFERLREKQSYCYQFSVRSVKQESLIISGSISMVVARHPTYGIIGLRWLFQNDHEVPLIGKFCSTDGVCRCLEVGCSKNVNGKCLKLCQNSTNVSVENLICKSGYIGALIKILDIRNLSINSKSYQNATAHILAIFPNTTEESMLYTEIMLLKASSCPCPILEENKFYILVAQRSAIKETRLRNRAFILIDSSVIVEAAFDKECNSNERIKLLSMLEYSNFQRICNASNYARL